MFGSNKYKTAKRNSYSRPRKCSYSTHGYKTAKGYSLRINKK